ncbi:hypothetical protein CBS101457_005228 [Exobasidium rhododendri]|nr:hypothetical protein CBS101457_005228 [Exobasidium rhododendri]
MMTTEATPSVPTKDHHFDPLGPGAARARAKETSAAPPIPPSKGMGKIASAFRRQTTEGKEAKRREKERRMNKAIDDSTTKSSRMDVIDRLDLSGIHGSSIFHHDSPYDACSPHSNRNTRRAPVMAFDPTIDPMTGQPIGMRAQDRSNSNRSPLATSAMRKMHSSDANDDYTSDSRKRSASNPKTSRAQVPTLRMNSNSYLSPDGSDQVSIDSRSSNIDRDVEAERDFRNTNYFNTPNNVSKGRADVAVPNADIWGVSSEPWQDFAQPATSPGGLRPGNGRGGHRLSGESGGSGNASAASSIFDMEAVMTGKKSVPPPSTNNHLTVESGPKRSKSLIKKIRTARQNPNVPPPQDDDVGGVEMGNMSISNDSGLKSNTSKRYFSHGHSPSTPPMLQSQNSYTSGYNRANNSSLGRSGTLRAGSGNGFYNREGVSTATEAPASSSGGLGRSNSIFNKFRGVGKNRESIRS